MFSKVWWLSAAERAGKTFLQAYLTFWIMVAGFASGAAQVNADAFDLLFTWNNVKAGVVGLALSLATSVGSTKLGPDSNAPSLTVTETKPTQPPT
jgi:hypothetical protein